MGLAVPAKPAQEGVGRPYPFRRDDADIVLEHPIHEDRQFVDRENDGSAARRQRRKDVIASPRPVSGIDPAAQLHSQIGNRQLLDPAAGRSQEIPEVRRDAFPCPAQRPRLYADLRDCVRRVCGSFQIDENRLEFARLR